jgi:hypothetical protein
MSKKDGSLYVQLGDIIQITSPSDITIHNKIFLVTFISNTNIKLVSDDGSFEYILRLNDDGTIGNESIEGINILSRDENVGYARQNKLLPGTWIDIYFSGDLPITITGIITNIEEDMIEIKTYPDNDVIYLDFAYKGFPEDMPIDKIIIRVPPSEFVENEIQILGEEERKEEVEEEDEELEEGEIAPSPKTPEKVNRVTPVELKTQIKELLLDADKILVGEQLDEIVQIIDVPEYEQRYNIDKQANDLLDEMLSSIPNAQRNASVINNIHKLIERFKQLRSEYSTFDKYGNADMPELKGANFKPLVQSLMNINKKLYWLLPVTKIKKKIYDMDEVEEDPETYKDVVPIKLSDERIREEEIIKMYKTNSIPDEENKYVYLMNELNTLFTPYVNPNRDEYRIIEKDIEDNINCIIDNLDEFRSSVVKKDEISRRKFVIQTYNLGLSRLQTIETERKKSYLKRVKLTPNDRITIKSFVSLPEPVLKYSHINLPNTNIFEKASLNLNDVCYWKLLNQKSPINQLTVDDLSKELPFDEKTYLNDVKEYLLNETIEDPDRYNKYLNSIIPKTRILFDLIKKYIDGNLSLYSIVKYMEPFLIYQKDLSFKQYESIIEFVELKIREFKKRYVEKTKEFRTLSKNQDYIDYPVLFLTNFTYQIDREILEYYDIKRELIVTSSELLYIFNELDNGRFLQVTLSNITEELCLPKHLKLFYTEENKLLQTYESTKNEGNCPNYILTKEYQSLEELEKDNGVDAYFDLDYTEPIFLDFILTYKKEQSNMQPDEFRTFLINTILDDMNTKNAQEAEEIADSNILGKRLIRDGYYAILNVEDEKSDFKSLNKTYSIVYYKRVSNRWEKATDIPANTHVEYQRFFCMTRDKCYSSRTNEKCMGYVPSEINNKDITAIKMNKEYDRFDAPSNCKKRDNSISLDLNDASRIKERLFKYKNNTLCKYNNKQVSIGETAEEYDVIVSPYAKLRDLILGHPDFVKKQDNIVRFVNEFTREPMDEEDKYWLYCPKTNTKLMPLFFERLAQSFISGDNYNDEYEKICAEQGTISDDGNAWVDKYSGYVIGRIDFDTEEGYDEQGFKVNTRDLLNVDISQKILGDVDTTKQYENPIARQISNVLHAMTTFMGINLDNERDFIVKNTLTSLQNEEIVPSKVNYDKSLKEALGRGKRLPPYDTIYDSSLIYLSLSYILISILTSMPSIRSKKTFPNCIKSFSGYPLTGVEDKTALTYICCVAHKIKSSVKPWSSINKASQPNIASRLEIILDRYVIPNKDVQLKLNEKREYLLKEKPDDIIPIEHDIINWINFLPPLREIKMGTPQNISPDFKATFIDNLKKGKTKQHEEIDVIKSKIIYFSLAIQKSIQNVVSKEMPILKNASMEPYLENACCNGEGLDTHKYFSSREPDITLYNNIVIDLQNVIDDIDRMTEAAILYDKTNTKRFISELSSEFTEDTIYRALVIYCRFNSILPINDNLRAICLEKPEDISVNDDVSEIVRKLKRDGRSYNKETLDLLMKIINSKNIVKLHLENVEFSPIHYLRNLTENKETSFNTLLYDALDTYEVATTEDSKEVRNLKNFLGRENESMLEKLKLFMKSHSKLNKPNYAEFVDTISNINDFNLIDNDTFNDSENTTTYVYVNFVKNMIRNLINVYPDIILNKVDYDEIDIPRHWKISYKHTTDIQTFVKRYYSPLREFYNNKHVERLLRAINKKTLFINKFAEKTPFFSPIIRDNNEIYSTFDKRMTSLIYKYYFFKVLNSYIELVNDKELLTIEKLKKVEYEEILTEVELEESETGDISELEILRGEKKEIATTIAELLNSFVSIIRDEKKTINYNHDKILEQVLRSKEKEKDDITSDLKRLTDDDREVENFFKNSKLEKWGVGLQKGFTRYAEGTYDQERENMEKRLLLDIKIGKNMQVHEMNSEIYVNDLLENERNEDMYNKEAYDMSDLPDDDDFGDREDREDVEGYAYVMDDARYD